MKVWVIQSLLAASERIRRFGDWPPFFVRVGLSYTQAAEIVYLANKEESQWSNDLVEKVIENLFEEQGTDISVFAAHTRDRFDSCHSLALMAGGISSEAFDSGEREKYRKKIDKAREAKLNRSGKSTGDEPGDDFGRKLVSFVLPRSLFSHARVVATPKNNANFGPADDLHHDAVPADVNAFARSFLDALRRGEVLISFVRKAEFRTHAAMALSSCVVRYGDLTTACAPWRDGAKLSGKEQLERLRLIAGDYGMQSHWEFHK